jgi:hypothetical protein
MGQSLEEIAGKYQLFMQRYHFQWLPLASRFTTTIAKKFTSTLAKPQLLLYQIGLTILRCATQTPRNKNYDS